jgi:hypothetical protein
MIVFVFSSVQSEKNKKEVAGERQYTTIPKKPTTDTGKG